MHIRPATVEDAHRIATIHVEAWRAAYGGVVPDSVLQPLSIEKREASWSKQLASGSSQTLVGEEQNNVVGWLDWGECRDADAAADAEVYAIYLDPAHFRRGIGSLLWREMLEQVRRGGRQRVAAWVLEDNHPAHRFYEAMGGEADDANKRIVVFDGVELCEMRYWFGCG
jgi:L-amino acid N-acyltransferase YncA